MEKPSCQAHCPGSTPARSAADQRVPGARWEPGLAYRCPRRAQRLRCDRSPNTHAFRELVVTLRVGGLPPRKWAAAADGGFVVVVER